MKCRSDGKPSFGTSEATDESLEGAYVDKAHSPKRGPSCIVPTPQDMEVTKGRDASDSEWNSATQILIGDAKGRGIIPVRTWIMKGPSRRLTVVSIWLCFPPLQVAVHK